MLYVYKIIRDFGFAPNPFFRICTLATCKPFIRKLANINDWVACFGGVNTCVANKLVCMMQVNKVISYDDYWENIDYDNKKPGFDKSYKYCYGDNIYHHDSLGNWLQEDSHHSFSDGISYDNLRHDTSVDRILISYHYWYFGEEAVEVPSNLSEIIPNWRNYKKFDNFICDKLIKWLKKNFSEGQHGLPSNWESYEFVRFIDKN